MEVPKPLPGSSSLKGDTHEETANWLLVVVVLLVVLILFLVVGYSLGWMTWNGITMPTMFSSSSSSASGTAPATTTATK